MPHKIAIIGAGNMGSAFYHGLCRPSGGEQIAICDRDSEKLEQLNAKCASTRADDIAADADIILFAVKPQSFEECVAGISTPLGDKLVISIMAGVTIAKLRRQTGSGRVVRSMPNLCARAGESITGWVASKDVTDEDRRTARRIFGAVGYEIELENESLVDVISATCGAGPAYFFLLCELLGNNLERLGFSKGEARKMSNRVLAGSAALAREAKSAKFLRESVTSEKGITQAALDVLNEKNLDTIFAEAVDAAIERSKELNAD